MTSCIRMSLKCQNYKTPHTHTHVCARAHTHTHTLSLSLSLFLSLSLSVCLSVCPSFPPLHRSCALSLSLSLPLPPSLPLSLSRCVLCSKSTCSRCYTSRLMLHKQSKQQPIMQVTLHMPVTVLQLAFLKHIYLEQMFG